MRFKIVNSDTGDYFVVEGETIEECREQALYNGKQKGWKNCYSEQLED